MFERGEGWIGWAKIEECEGMRFVFGGMRFVFGWYSYLSALLCQVGVLSLPPLPLKKAELTLLEAHHAMTSASCVMKRNAAIMMMPWVPTCASPILLKRSCCPRRRSDLCVTAMGGLGWKGVSRLCAQDPKHPPNGSSKAPHGSIHKSACSTYALASLDEAHSMPTRQARAPASRTLAAKAVVEGADNQITPGLPRVDTSTEKRPSFVRVCLLVYVLAPRVSNDFLTRCSGGACASPWLLDSDGWMLDDGDDSSSACFGDVERASQHGPDEGLLSQLSCVLLCVHVGEGGTSRACCLIWVRLMGGSREPLLSQEQDSPRLSSLFPSCLAKILRFTSLTSLFVLPPSP